MDHTNYPKSLKSKSTESLLFIIRDCQEALKAMPDNPKAGHYADEINYCSMEINRRMVKTGPGRYEVR